MRRPSLLLGQSLFSPKTTHFIITSFLFFLAATATEDNRNNKNNNHHATISNILAKGDLALMDNEIELAIQHYEKGIQLIPELNDYESNTNKQKNVPPPLIEVLSIYTNLGTAYSIMRDHSHTPQYYQQKTMQAYHDAIQYHQDQVISIVDQNQISISNQKKKEVDKLAAQAAFFLGLEYQDMEKFQEALNVYTMAYTLDPNHWSAVANIGSLLNDYRDPQDSELNPRSDSTTTTTTTTTSTMDAILMNMNSPFATALLQSSHSKRMEKALMAYNRAFQILTQTTEEPTDYPNDPNFILSELQHRIGVILTNAPESRTCAILSDKEDDNTTTDGSENVVSCKEMATHAFSLAVEYDHTNEPARHMLAAVTADATVKRASNQYVTELFEQYAKNFEHSLVDELGYNGYERLRRGFDRAYGGQKNVPTFSLVVDAGCGTGLAGEQFRNVSQYLIGADLSESILEEAKKMRPNLYDDTYLGDVTDLFERFYHRPQALSLIIAADSFIYFGDLMPLFQSISMGLMSNGAGVLAFTLENVSMESEKSLLEITPNWRWQLTASGRFAHRKDYVEYVADQNSIELIHYEPLDGFRYEKGVAVRGHLFIMKTKIKGNNAANLGEEL